MIRAISTILFALAMAAPAAAEPRGVGLYDGWAALAESSPHHCYAIARPESGKMGASASAAIWPGRAPGIQIHFRLSAPRRPGSAILLRIDGRTFAMIGNGAEAWAPDARSDAAIVAAMRIGGAMRIETRSVRGVRIADRYPLRGAASAIDAAAIACAG
jgi:hypothetical protein